MSDSFKDQQKKYPRVRQAYAEKEEIIRDLLTKNDILLEGFRIHLRAFKAEKKIEVWARNKSDKTFTMIKEFAVCETSGNLGPKRKEGDLQIPEGFYHINRFNPTSNFYLSLGINYPNAADRVLAHKEKPGGDIFIHGACVTIGCLPITDDKIKELYLLCVEAKDQGQEKIPVTIFPARLTAEKYESLKSRYPDDSDKLNLWADLKQEHDHFATTKTLPQITFLKNGRHTISP